MSVRLPPLRVSDPAVFGRVAVLMGGTSSERRKMSTTSTGAGTAPRSG